MKRDHRITRATSNCRHLWVLLLFFLLFQPSLASGQQLRPEIAARTATLSAPLLAEGWSWRSLFNPVEVALGNRRRMFQFATLGMCLGLYILMRK